MTLGKLLPTGHAGRASAVNKKGAVIAQANARVVCESLERRRLLATYTYVVPPGHTAAYIEARAGGLDGQVQVRLDSPTGPIDHEFENTTGMDIINSGTNGTPQNPFLFVDKVSAEDKPTTDGFNDGILVLGGSGGHLKIEAQPDDRLIYITESTGTSATVQVRGAESSIANSRFGSGVNKLTIQTRTAGFTDVRVASFGPQPQLPEPVIPPLPGLSGATSLTIESLGTDDTIRLGGQENAAVAAVVHTGAGNDTVILNQDNDADATSSIVVDFDPNLGSGSGNRLEVGTVGDVRIGGVNCVATLALAPGASAHTIKVDSISVNNGTYVQVMPPAPGASPATVIVQAPAIIGELSVGYDHLGTGEDDSELDVDSVASIQAPVTIANSSSTSGKIIADGTVEFTGGSDPSIVHQFDITTDVVGSTGVVKIQSEGDVTALTSSRIGALQIAVDGTFTLQQRPQPPTSGNARLLILGSLFIEKAPTAPEGILDLKDNAMIVDYFEDSPIEDIQQYITFAYDVMGSTHWTTDDILRDGINSSVAAMRTDVGIGYGEATDIFSSFPATWEGQNNVDATSVLVKYTYYGDANLNGSVTLPDFNRLGSNFGESPRRWTEGDFNYDTQVGLPDFNRLAANFGRGDLGPGDGTEGECSEWTAEDLEEYAHQNNWW